jgi:hypothetical protein
MGAIRLQTAPMRSMVRFPLLQLFVVAAAML